MKIRIGNRWVGQDEPLYFIADIASNHDGDLKRAFKLIELAKQSGADAAKFQNFSAPNIVSKTGFDLLQGQLSHQKTWTKSVYETYQDASIPIEWIPELKMKCDEVGIEFLTSPYDFQAVDIVDPFLNAFKIGSGDITWIEILEYISQKQKPIILSTGASTQEDVDRAVKSVYKNNQNLILMQCNTNYTANNDNFKYINLKVLRTYARQYPDAIFGLSDHTLGNTTVLGAIALGAVVFEKHFTDDNSRMGPDHSFAMNPTTWKEMFNRANEMYYALGDGIKKIELNENETSIIQKRCLRYTGDLPKGHILTKEDLFPLRPIPPDGIPPYEINNLIDRILNKQVFADNHIKWEDLEK